MPNDKVGGNAFNDISAIDARLAELDKEKEHLLALRGELLRSQTNTPAVESFSPDQGLLINTLPLL